MLALPSLNPNSLIYYDEMKKMKQDTSPKKTLGDQLYIKESKSIRKSLW